MATRTIVTSHPELPCDVCGRRLLRGERPDVFVAGGGRRLTVCELCTPRAAHEGWRRESAQADDLELGPARPRRARNLFGRLRQLREPATGGDATAPPAEALPATSAASATSASTSAQAMAEEFEPAQPLHGAIAGPHSVAAPVAAPALEEVERVAERSHERSHDESVRAGVVRAESVRAGVVRADPLETDSPEEKEEPVEPVEPVESVESVGSVEPVEPDVPDGPAEEGTWRDAWMFVGE